MLGFGAQYPKQFFGTCEDRLTDELWVMRVPGGDFDRTVLDTVPHLGVTIRFTDAVAPRRYLVELARRIQQTDSAYWAAKGVTIQSVWLSEDGGGISVVTDQADAARADILARYGAEVIEVRPVR
ncbi:hypothetical protein [Kitasatospora sp. NPDC057500]|uniref:hypothetical protein n=1 Tax=Kitasatospora sp. NPDC057500 TaxID=3346151 RepID=UPI003697E04A